MEEFNSDESTQGVSSKGFIPVEPDKNEPTKTHEEPDSGLSREDKYGIYGIPKAVKALEEHSAFTGPMLALVGYIIIAAFGRITNFADFERYVLFLVLIFVLYRILKMKLQDFVMRKKDWILLVLCVLLGLFIVFDHIDQITYGFSKIYETLRQSSIEPEKAAGLSNSIKN